MLLEQRPATGDSDAGNVGAAALRGEERPETELRMTVRHAIMQVNYYVRIRTVS